jgi:hypothetical protein
MRCPYHSVVAVGVLLLFTPFHGQLATVKYEDMAIKDYVHDD